MLVYINFDISRYYVQIGTPTFPPLVNLFLLSLLHCTALWTFLLLAQSPAINGGRSPGSTPIIPASRDELARSQVTTNDRRPCRLKMPVNCNRSCSPLLQYRITAAAGQPSPHSKPHLPSNSVDACSTCGFQSRPSWLCRHCAYEK